MKQPRSDEYSTDDMSFAPAFLKGLLKLPAVTRTISLASLVTAFYLFAFAVVFWLLMPIQVYVASKYVTFAQFTCFVALTHGVRVVATWLLRWRAVFYLAPGVMVEAVVLTNHYALAAGDWTLLVVALASTSFISFEILRAFGWDPYADIERPSCFRSVIAAGVLASFANALIFTMLDFGVTAPTFSVWLMLNAIIGGVVGLYIWLFLLRGILHTAVKAP